MKRRNATLERNRPLARPRRRNAENLRSPHVISTQELCSNNNTDNILELTSSPTSPHDIIESLDSLTISIENPLPVIRRPRNGENEQIRRQSTNSSSSTVIAEVDCHPFVELHSEPPTTLSTMKFANIHC